MRGYAITATLFLGGVAALTGIATLFGSFWKGLIVLLVAAIFFAAAMLTIRKNSAVLMVVIWGLSLAGLIVLLIKVPPDVGLMDGGPIILMLFLFVASGFVTSLLTNLKRDNDWD